MAKDNRKRVNPAPALTQPPGTRMPKGEKELAFCEFWLSHFDHVRAYKQAGYQRSADKALRLYRILAPYLEKLRTEKGKVLAKRLAVREADVLDEIVALGFANPQDYVEEYIEEIAGKPPATKHRRRPLMELTRAQAAAVTCIKFHPDGTVTYELPEPKDKRPALELVGKNFGMFDQKLIAEHRHIQKQRSTELEKIDTDKLQAFEEALIEAIGPRAAQNFIGYTREVEEESDAP